MSPLQPAQELALSNPGPPQPSPRKSKKARGVWISFMGRVVAQFVGASSSVVLGLFVLHHHQSADAAAKAQTARVATPNPVVRTVSHMAGSASIAVAPLRDASSGAAGRGFADALTGAITVSLVKTAGIHVASVTDPAIAALRPSGADYLLGGSVLVDGRQLRVIVSLVDAITNEHVWAESFHTLLADPIATQDQIAADITAQITALMLAGSSPAPVTRSVVHATGGAGVRAPGTFDETDTTGVAPVSSESITQ